MRDLVVSLWRLYEADECDLLEIESTHRRGGRRKLPFAAIDEYELRQRLLFIELTSITAKNCLVHRCKIFCTFDSADNEPAIAASCRFAVLENDNARHIHRAADIRDIERLDP